MNKKEFYAILIGAVIMLVPSLLVYKNLDTFGDALSWALWMIGGFAAAFIGGKNIKCGVLNGFLAAIISGVIVIIIFTVIMKNHDYSSNLVNNVITLAFIAIVFIVYPGIFSMIGGYFGGLTNRLRNKN